MHDIHGTEKGCYDRLRWYCRVIRETNPGSVAECEIDPVTSKFKWSLIFLDEPRIKNKYKDCILVAVSNDANDDLFTIGYSIVDAENDAVEQLFVGSHHSYCLRHLVDNFVKRVLRSYQKHNKKHWSSVFKKVAYTPSLQEHEQHINNIIDSMPLARVFIVQSHPQSWANALFLGDRWGVMNNNIAECWNNWVKLAHYLPIVAMVDHIHMQIMNIIHR
ncbi:uncharacterized protein LOC122003088 [Zingiber officinale]|uniref:uncharacterized protein LOC122003088 n=1 Tax=Zingiber officinale TaxID=94328 RepID=UPI001C4C14AE|nr:uncharacterized protein LOC122003088 [Zingiber officinale]